MMQILFRTLILFIFSCAVLNVSAAEHTVTQKDKVFSVKTLKIKVGDIVSFLNQDSFFHNVFSLSDAKFFDLGSYPQGQSKSVAFDKVGIVEVECAVHPEMRLTIEVAK